MKYSNSPSISLFEQLGSGLDVLGQVPVPATHRYAEDAAQGEIAPSEVPADSLDPMQSPQKDMASMKFTHSLIKHLDMLYSRMLAGEISDGLQQSSAQDDDIIDIAGLPHVQKHAYYNPGNSAVTESM